MTTPVLLRRLFVVLTLLTLAACSYENMIRMVASDSEIEFAKSFIEQLRNREYDSAIASIDSSILDQVTVTRWNEIASYFPEGDVETVEVAGANALFDTSTKRLDLCLEYKFADSWAVATIVLRRTDSVPRVLGFQVYRTTQSLRSTHEFNLTGKTWPHYLILASAVLFPLFIILTLIVCIRTPIRKRKWLWILFIIPGLVSIWINWHTGEMSWQLISFQLCGASVASPGPFAPWTLGVALPLGAVLFWIRRRRLIAEPTDQPASPMTPVTAPNPADRGEHTQ